jgi:hypothetical protein
VATPAFTDSFRSPDDFDWDTTNKALGAIGSTYQVPQPPRVTIEESPAPVIVGQTPGSEITAMDPEVAYENTLAAGLNEQDQKQQQLNTKINAVASMAPNTQQPEKKERGVFEGAVNLKTIASLVAAYYTGGASAMYQAGAGALGTQIGGGFGGEAAQKLLTKKPEGTPNG